jgi:hypothetical protein
MKDYTIINELSKMIGNNKSIFVSEKIYNRYLVFLELDINKEYENIRFDNVEIIKSKQS